MKISRLRFGFMGVLLTTSSIFMEAPVRAAESGRINCNGLQNFLAARTKYGRSALPRVCSQNFTWRGRIDCSKGPPVVRYNVGMADAEWICKKLIYARGEELPYRELRALLIASGALPSSSSDIPYNYKEISCGNRLCSATWILQDRTIIHVTLRRDGDQLATYEYE